MLLSLILIITCIPALIRRSATAGVYALMVLIQDMIFYQMFDIDGVAYYGSCIVASGLLISALYKLPRSNLGLSLIHISIVAIIVNIAGMLSYVLYQDPDAYDLSVLIVSIFAIITMVYSDDRENGIHFMASRWSSYVEPRNKRSAQV